MGLKRWASLAVTALLASLTAWGHGAVHGGADSGGGNIPQSTAAQVKTALGKLGPWKLREVFSNLGDAMDQVKDPYIKRILVKLYADRASLQPLLGDIAATKLEIREDGGCMDAQGKAHMMGVRERKLGSPICASIPLPRAIPQADLETHLLALLAHEYAHHFGFGEHEATRFQTFMLHNVKKLSGEGERFFIDLKEISLPSHGRHTQLYAYDGKFSAHAPGTDGAADPYCLIDIEYGRKDWDFNTDTKPALSIDAQRVEVKLDEFRWSSSSEAPDSYHLRTRVNINPVWSNWRHEPTGVRAKVPGKDDRLSLVRAFHCSGTNFRIMTLKQIFGDLIQGPILFEK